MDTAEWDDDEQRWQVRTSRGDQLSPRFLVTAGGILHKAKLPGISGIEDFEGHSFHTSRWDYGYTGGSAGSADGRVWRDKRVGIIGTGATAIQAVPQLAAAAKELFVFQRTPSPVGQRDNGPTDVEWFTSQEPGWQSERIRNFTQAVTGDQARARPGRRRLDRGHVGGHPERDRRPGASRRDGALGLRDHGGAASTGSTRSSRTPRPPRRSSPGTASTASGSASTTATCPSFNRPNVHLVDTDGRGVEAITAKGVVVAGEEYPVDLLVFASGFEVTTDLEQRLGFDPRGRGGVAMSERWHDGAHTLHGVLSAEFPNLMMISLVQAGFGTNFLHFLSESAKHVAWLIAECIDEGVATIEATVEAEEEWHSLLLGVAMGIAEYSTNCTPGYYNGEQGHNPKAARNLVYTGSLLDYAGYLERWRDAGGFPGARVVRAG